MHVQALCIIISITVDLPTSTPGWPTSSVGVDGQLTRVDSAPITCSTGGQEQIAASNGAPLTTDIGECHTASVCV